MQRVNLIELNFEDLEMNHIKGQSSKSRQEKLSHLSSYHVYVQGYGL